VVLDFDKIDEYSFYSQQLLHHTTGVTHAGRKIRWKPYLGKVIRRLNLFLRTIYISKIKIGIQMKINRKNVKGNNDYSTNGVRRGVLAA